MPKEQLRASPRKTFARWHVHPLSIDNKDPSIDFYTNNMTNPAGYGGQYAAMGGFARQRPLPRPSIAASDWQVADMMTEVQRAIALGVDGFAFSVFQMPPKDGWLRLTRMLEAASRVDPLFRVMICLDYPSLVGGPPTADQLADAIASVATHPSVFRAADGRLVVTAVGADMLGFTYSSDLVAALWRRGISVYFVAFDHNWSSLDRYPSIASGYGRFGATNVSSAAAYAADPAIAHGKGKTYMGTVLPQLFRPRLGWYVEACNSETLRATWKVAIDSQPDWLMLRNWNDYAEGNEFSPSTGTQWAFYDLAAYYNTWYKTKVQPQIKRDVLYYVHRIQPTTAAPDPTKQTQMIVPRLDNPEGCRNNIELLAFLASPGTLSVTIGGRTTQMNAPAGITSFKVPLANGVPTFRLSRGGTSVIAMNSTFEIRDQIVYQDLLYRAGSSTRQAVAMAANPKKIR